MSQALQISIVTLLVIGATLFASWRLMSGAMRLRTLEALLGMLPQGDPEARRGLSAWLQGLAAKQRTATGCSACERNPKRS